MEVKEKKRKLIVEKEVKKGFTDFLNKKLIEDDYNNER